MKVLIVKLSALGDIIHSLPVAMAIRRQVPEARIDWIVEAPSYDLLHGHKALNRVLLSPRHALSAASGRKNFSLLANFIRELGSVRYDAVLDLQGLMKSSLFVLLSRARIKTGFRGGKEPLSVLPLNLPLPAYDIERHALERYLDLLQPVGLRKPEQIEYGLETDMTLQARWRQRLQGPGPLLIMHPMAKWKSKLWPEESWAWLAARLLRKGVRVAFSGTKEDKAVNARIIARIGWEQEGSGLFNLSGLTDLQDLMAVLSLTDLIISTDTGVMHLAAAMDVPLLALFGPTAPNRTGPYGQLEHVIINRVECRPCFRRSCSYAKCMGELKPETVLRACWERLSL
ncbi:MAG: glycosyltransferase family 9 protein [Desulfarculales bacterium]|jgi:lipopolysaccharide heptosyltransferase I|nr:glycosyltransferase family 9 protein [Desulfarculales bacterium]